MPDYPEFERYRAAGGYKLLGDCLDGKRQVEDVIKARLGIDVGETTDDGRVTLQAVECLCACEAAPMMHPSTTAWGFFSMIVRSLKVPGSPSSALMTR